MHRRHLARLLGCVVGPHREPGVCGGPLLVPVLSVEVRLGLVPGPEPDKVGERAPDQVKVWVQLPDEALADGHRHDRHRDVPPQAEVVLLHHLEHVPHHLPHVDRPVVGAPHRPLHSVLCDDDVHLVPELAQVHLLGGRVVELDELLHHPLSVARAQRLQEVAKGRRDVVGKPARQPRVEDGEGAVLGSHQIPPVQVAMDVVVAEEHLHVHIKDNLGEADLLLSHLFAEGLDGLARLPLHGHKIVLELGENVLHYLAVDPRLNHHAVRHQPRRDLGELDVNLSVEV
mmetsp:Transcript_13101/g.30422  ORF Transcript_13101/g.30422 Transcript_13101/m.30422 type:complete len:286 (-) Transcript_13101:499-1356(-)